MFTIIQKIIVDNKNICLQHIGTQYYFTTLFKFNIRPLNIKIITFRHELNLKYKTKLNL